MTEPIGALPVEVVRPFPTTEILVGRTDVLISALDTAIREGNLDPNLVRSLKSGAPRVHDDLVMVYLGLKPSAVLIWYEVTLYHGSFYRDGYRAINYLKHFPISDLEGGNFGVALISDDRAEVASYWNQPVVEKVVRNNPDVFEGEFDYSNAQTLAEELAYFQSVDTNPDEGRIFGLLLGFPRSAVESLARYAEVVVAICEARKHKDLQFFNSESEKMPFGQILYNENGARDRLVAFLEASEFRVDPGVLDYIRSLRPAEVPGYRYATTGPISDHETQLTAAWEASGVDAKLEALLEAHGV